MFLFLATISLKAQVSVSIRFDLPDGKIISPYAFGLNVFQGFDPAQAGTPGKTAYKSAMADMAPGIIRYHSWNMMGASTTASGWLNANQDWDAMKISKALSGAYSFKPVCIMNIPSWPDKWKVSSSDEHLVAAHYQDFADWCASLVKIVNIDQSRGIVYWEITNERDDLYDGKYAELGKIYNLAAIAMKAIDPAIKTGGLAFARPDKTNNIDAFFSTCKNNIDFATYHSYSTGDVNATNASLYDNASGLGWITNSLRGEWAKYSGKKIEFFHDEFNISWSPPDVKQTNNVGQTFDALAMLALVKAGASGSLAWNECDGWYGKMDNSYKLRPSAYLYKNLNQYLKGNSVYKSSSTNEKLAVVLASRNDSLFNFVVVNRADKDITVKFTFTGLPAGVLPTTNFTNSENQLTGGIIQKNVSYSQLADPLGVIFKSGVVAIFTLNIKTLSLGTDILQKLNQNTSVLSIYPNPASKSIVIDYELESYSNVKIAIFDTFGKELITLMNEKQVNGKHTASLNTSEFNDGIYFIRMENKGIAETKKVVISNK